MNFTPVPSEGSTHEHVTFKKRVQAGRYYVYAVANISDEQKSELEGITSIEALRIMRINWNDDIARDLEMFGVFRHDGADVVPDNESFEADELLTITPATNSIHSWVRRVASKVTVDFDGTNLKEGVTVYIKSATLKDVASHVLLGMSPSTVGTNKIERATSEYTINYGEGENHSSWPMVTSKHAFSPADVWGTPGVGSFHDDNAQAASLL